MDKKSNDQVPLNTNLYSVHPDIDDKVKQTHPEKDETPSDEEIIQQNEIINPDENTLDRG